MAKVLVTGGSGFVGSNVVDALIQAGHEVTVVDSRRKPHRADVVWKDVDILDFPALLQATQGAEHWFHLAAVSNVNYAYEYPVYCTDLNIRGTAHVLEAARIHKPKRVYLASTVWVYNGCQAQEPVVENTAFELDAVGHHTYTSSKLSAELLMHNYQKLYGVNFTIFRYGIIYGPRMREELLIPVFLRKAFNRQPLTITGEGTQYRNFVYVTDLAQAHVLAMQDRAANQTYNLEGPKKITVRHVAESIQQLFPPGEVKVEFLPPRPGDFSGKFVSNAKATAELGWVPRVNFEDGLKSTVDFFRSEWKV